MLWKLLNIRRVEGQSMMPGIIPGDIVLALALRPRQGDIVIARQNGREVLKRIATIEEDNYYLAGDNMSRSTDSRQHGPVKKKDIAGRVVALFPVAVAPVKPRHRSARPLGWILAGVSIIFALVHLFRIDTLIPILDLALPGALTVATTVTLAVVLSEVFAAPYLMAMRLSPLGHIVSGGLVLLSPLIWTLLCIWTVDSDVASVGQLGEFVPLGSSWWLLLLNLGWLSVSFYLLWLRNFETSFVHLRKHL